MSAISSEINLCLMALNHKNHSNRVKGLKKFEEYVLSSHPTPSTQDVDLLYKGNPSEGLVGLIEWCGLPSKSHEG